MALDRAAARRSLEEHREKLVGAIGGYALAGHFATLLTMALDDLDRLSAPSSAPPTPSRAEDGALRESLREIEALARECAEYDASSLAALLASSCADTTMVTARQYWSDRATITRSFSERVSNIVDAALTAARDATEGRRDG